jgi:CIC family chloride channel protein
MFMLFELTGSYQIVLPLLVACGVAAAAVHLALGGSMYELKARARGVRRQRGSHLRELSVSAAVELVEPLREDLGWAQLVRRVADSTHAAYPVVDGAGQLVGMLSVREVRAALLDPTLQDVAVARDLARRAPALQLDDSLERALDALHASGATEAAVLDAASTPVGVLTREALLEAWRRAAEPH